jgi:hypothetical protein
VEKAVGPPVLVGGIVMPIALLVSAGTVPFSNRVGVAVALEGVISEVPSQAQNTNINPNKALTKKSVFILFEIFIFNSPTIGQPRADCIPMLFHSGNSRRTENFFLCAVSKKQNIELLI